MNFTNQPRLERASYATLVLLAIFLATSSLLTLLKAREIGRAVPYEHQITVVGEARTKQVPNIATVTLGVEVKEADVATAQEKNTSVNNTLIAKTKELGISEADIQTSQYNVYENTRWNQEKNELESVGWIVSQTITVKVRDTSKTGGLIAMAGKNGATSISGPNLTVDDSTDAKNEARKEAIEKAKEQAEALRTSLGLKKMELAGYNEWFNEGTPPIYYAREGMGAGGSAEPTIAPGTAEGVLTVNLTYTISE